MSTVGSKNVPSSLLPPRTTSAPRGGRVGHVALDLLGRAFVDQRPDLDAVLEPVADLQRGDRCLEAIEERVVHGVLDEDPIRRDARLAGVAELAHDRARDGRVEIGVVEDDEGRVAAELERDLLHLAGALRSSGACRPRSNP